MTNWSLPDLISYDTEDDGVPSTCRPVQDACGRVISWGDLDGDGTPEVTPYRADFYGNWTMDRLQIGETDLDASQDMIDISKWRIESPTETEHIWDAYQQNSYCAVWLGHIDGPVRVIRAIQAAQSGGTTRKYEYAYPGELITQVFMRVHGVTGPIYGYLDINKGTTSIETDRAKLYKDGYVATPYDEIGEAVAPPTCDKEFPATCYRPHNWFSVSTRIGSFLQYYRVKTGQDAAPTIGSMYEDSDNNIWPAGRDDAHAPEWDGEPEDHLAALTTYGAIADSQNPICTVSDGDPLTDDRTLVAQSTVVMLSAGHTSGFAALAEFNRRDRGVFGVCAAKEDSGGGPGTGCGVLLLHPQYASDGGAVNLSPQPFPGCDLTAWNLYRQVGAGIWRRIATTPGTLVFKGATLALGEQATYAASGYGSDCVESELSSPIAVLHDDIVPPGPPEGVDAEPGTGEITVRWSRPEDPDVVGYKVLVASEISGPFTQVHVGALEEMSTVYSFPAAPGQIYYVAVRALDQAGNQGELSLPVEVEMP